MWGWVHLSPAPLSSLLLIVKHQLQWLYHKISIIVNLNQPLFPTFLPLQDLTVTFKWSCMGTLAQPLNWRWEGRTNVVSRQAGQVISIAQKVFRKIFLCVWLEQKIPGDGRLDCILITVGYRASAVLIPLDNNKYLEAEPLQRDYYNRCLSLLWYQNTRFVFAVTLGLR